MMDPCLTPHSLVTLANYLMVPDSEMQRHYYFDSIKCFAFLN